MKPDGYLNQQGAICTRSRYWRQAGVVRHRCDAGGLVARVVAFFRIGSHSRLDLFQPRELASLESATRCALIERIGQLTTGCRGAGCSVVWKLYRFAPTLHYAKCGLIKGKMNRRGALLVIPLKLADQLFQKLFPVENFASGTVFVPSRPGIGHFGNVAEAVDTDSDYQVIALNADGKCFLSWFYVHG